MRRGSSAGMRNKRPFVDGWSNRAERTFQYHAVPAGHIAEAQRLSRRAMWGETLDGTSAGLGTLGLAVTPVPRLFHFSLPTDLANAGTRIIDGLPLVLGYKRLSQ